MKNAKRTLVFIAGPYSGGDTAANVRLAMEAWHHLADIGATPFCPHLSHFLHLHRPMPYDFWLHQSMAWVGICEVVLRLPGYSPGGDAEVEQAQNFALPVFDTVAEVEEWMRKNGRYD